MRCNARWISHWRVYYILNPLSGLRRPYVGCRMSTNSVAKETLTSAIRYSSTSARYLNSSLASSVNTESDTIYALSTAPGRAGIAIVRISGPACLEVYRSICPSRSIPKPRFAAIRTLYDPNPGLDFNILDKDALVLYFPSPKTVTGEDVLELHIHGGPATVKAVLRTVESCSTSTRVRYAEPGEFTRRAFENNRLDLAQVEALGDILSADTEQQRRASIRGSSGALGRRYESWRQQLLEARGELEAIIDFSEDQDFDVKNSELLGNIIRGVEKIRNSIETHKEASRRGELLRKGIRISLLGPPNAGKSSLLNCIVGREASIVSTEPGTTRDIVEVSLDIGGYLCTFADTAGLRSQPNLNSNNHELQQGHVIGAVEQEGIRRAKMKAADSDIVIVICSIERSIDRQIWHIEYDMEALEIAADAQSSIIIINKIDLVPDEVFQELRCDFRKSLLSGHFTHGQPAVIGISCHSNNSVLPGDAGNIRSLIDHLLKSFQEMTACEDEDLYGVTERQRQLLAKCDDHLQDYLAETQVSAQIGDDFDIVLAAEHLRSAGDCLSRITGRGEAGDVEEVLGVVFQKFCVGK